MLRVAGCVDLVSHELRAQIKTVRGEEQEGCDSMMLAVTAHEATVS